MRSKSLDKNQRQSHPQNSRFLYTGFYCMECDWETLWMVVEFFGILWRFPYSITKFHPEKFLSPFVYVSFYFTVDLHAHSCKIRSHLAKIILLAVFFLASLQLVLKLTSITYYCILIEIRKEFCDLIG